MAAVRLFFFLLLLLFSPTSLSQPSTTTDEDLLLRFKASFTNADPVLGSWAPTTSACADHWVGVVCYDGVITVLHLSGLSLAGEIDPTPLMELQTLTSITITNNTFAGPVPEFNKLADLRVLILSYNQFSGQVPDDYFDQMGSLERVSLSGNQLTGKLPGSLTKLPMLVELHLDNNQFAGPIPDLDQTTLDSVDFSNNRLEGPIPIALAGFDPKSFAGNDGLCGKPLTNECDPVAARREAAESSGSPEPDPTGQGGALIALVIGAAVVIAITLACAHRKEDEFTKLEKEKLGDPLQGEAGRKSHGGGGGGQRSKKGNAADFVMVNEEMPEFKLADLMKAAAEVLGNGAMGSAYKAVMSTGLSVVVKRMKGMTKIGRDTFDREMRRMGNIRHKNILSPLSYHYKKEEKLVVSEYIPKGSLLYVLHGDRGISHSELTWPTRLRIIRGIGSGMRFLHEEFWTHDVPHGNLKSSNVLLTDDYEPLINDYGFYHMINPCAAPQIMFACRTPEFVSHQHISPKSDVYCLGIIILEILTGKFPAQYLSTGNGGIDVVEWVCSAAARNKEAELIDPDLTTSAPSSVGQMRRLLKLGVACTVAMPGHRPGMKEAIRRIEEVQVLDT